MTAAAHPNQPRYTIACHHCAAPFESLNVNAKWCSNACRHKAHSRTQSDVACIWCGNALTVLQVFRGNSTCGRRCGGRRPGTTHGEPVSTPSLSDACCLAPVRVGVCRGEPRHAERGGVPTLCDQHQRWREEPNTYGSAWSRYSLEARP